MKVLRVARLSRLMWTGSLTRDNLYSVNLSSSSLLINHSQANRYMHVNKEIYFDIAQEYFMKTVARIDHIRIGESGRRSPPGVCVCGRGGGEGVLEISLDGEVRPGPSNPDPL